MSSRRKSRECALQMLFQKEVNQYSLGEISEIYWQLYPADSETRKFAQFLFSLSVQNQEEVDSWIRRHAEHWRLERMARVDRNVLRLAVTELLFADTPEAVVIDEAIEIARRFSTEDSAEFVNGILDSVVRKMRNLPPNKKAPAVAPPSATEKQGARNPETGIPDPDPATKHLA